MLLGFGFFSKDSVKPCFNLFHTDDFPRAHRILSREDATKKITLLSLLLILCGINDDDRRRAIPCHDDRCPLSSHVEADESW